MNFSISYTDIPIEQPKLLKKLGALDASQNDMLHKIT